MKNRAKVLQVCGTGSGVGKSVIVAGLCRILRQEGFTVAPFKAQNMALNSAVTKEGLEIGRAQAMQAEACGILPQVEMNPVLLKPISNAGSQVIVRGEPAGNMSAEKYYQYKTKIFTVVKKSLNKLRNDFDIVIIEGAGSPAEINLKKHDIVNMKVAGYADAPVLLVGDIDSGGVFAWLLGTLSLLTGKERSLVKGLIINKFRGDINLLESGVKFLERKGGKKVLGIIPYYTDISLPEEDSLFFSDQKHKETKLESSLLVAVVKLPHISNFTDFDPLNLDDDVELIYTIDPEILNKADSIIVPGTRNTLCDLQFLKEKKIDFILKERSRTGVNVVGICGGFQILGKTIIDKLSIESSIKYEKGLSLLNVETSFEKKKKTYNIAARTAEGGISVTGYEIHHGRTKKTGKLKPKFLLIERDKKTVNIEDGAINEKGNVWGTYIHGIFDNDSFRMEYLNGLRRGKGLKPKIKVEGFSRDKEYDKLALHLQKHIDLKALKKIIFD